MHIARHSWEGSIEHIGQYFVASHLTTLLALVPAASINTSAARHQDALLRFGFSPASIHLCSLFPHIFLQFVLDKILESLLPSSPGPSVLVGCQSHKWRVALVGKEQSVTLSLRRPPSSDSADIETCLCLHSTA